MPSANLIGEYGHGGGLLEETVWLGDIPVATLRPNGSSVTIYYIHTDHLNAPRLVSRPTDNLQMWTWFSEPFGNNVVNTNPQGGGYFFNKLRFPGQANSTTAVSSVYPNFFRDYDPAVGRYIESDPIGLTAGINTYAYTRGNPIIFIDFSGLLSTEACAALQRLIDYDNSHSKIDTLGAYGTLSSSDDSVALDAAFPSTGGPVSIDWMMRSGGYGLTSLPPFNFLAYSFGKQIWNLMNGTNPYTNISSPANFNAPTALTAWLYGRMSLAEMFAPALQECEGNCGDHVK